MRKDLWGVLWLISEIASAAQSVSVDVNPWSNSNEIQPESGGTITVAVKGSSAFDVAQIDPASLRFGPWGAEPQSGPIVGDLDGDGKPDAVFGFPVNGTGIECGASAASLYGRSLAGDIFSGSDSISTIDCNVAPPDLEVAIDVDPWSTADEVTPDSSELIEVLVLGSSLASGDAIDFDASEIDPDSLTFGYWRAANKATPSVLDFNGDGNTDALFGFRTRQTRIMCEDTEVALFGETYGGEEIRGVASINTPPCEAGCHSETASTEAGRVKFFVDAKSNFDAWTLDPTETQKAFMRDNYFRMQTYSPYFDERLLWYPDAWEYEDAYKISVGGSTQEEHPEWILKSAAGKRLYIPYACSGGSCPLYAGDIGNAAFRSFWLDRLAASMSAGYIGVFIDDLNMIMRVSNAVGDDVRPIDPRTGLRMSYANWQKYMAEFAEAVRERFPATEISHNVIHWAKPEDSDGDYLTRQALAADYINLERGATDKGMVAGKSQYGYEAFLAYIDWVHSLGRHVTLDDDDSNSIRDRDFELASYFLINDGGDMLGADGDRARMNPDNFWSGYQIDLGAPLGARYRQNGIFRRDFQCGTVLVNQPQVQIQIIELGEVMTDLDGNDVDAVILGAFEGEVLVRSCP